MARRVLLVVWFLLLAVAFVATHTIRNNQAQMTASTVALWTAVITAVLALPKSQDGPPRSAV